MSKKNTQATVIAAALIAVTSEQLVGDDVAATTVIDVEAAVITNEATVPVAPPKVTDRQIIRAGWITHAPKRLSGEWSNTKFRKEVMSLVQAPFGTATLSSAATSYNAVFHEMRSNPELVYTCEGLGRQAAIAAAAALKATEVAAATTEVSTAQASNAATQASDNPQATSLDLRALNEAETV